MFSELAQLFLVYRNLYVLGGEKLLGQARSAGRGADRAEAAHGRACAQRASQRPEIRVLVATARAQTRLRGRQLRHCSSDLALTAGLTPV